MRSGKELILASKPYARELPIRSWWCLGSTIAVLAGLASVFFFGLPWFALVPLSILTGLVLVRLFIIYHDYMHGTILRKSKVAKFIMHFFGLFALSAPDIWKHTHDDHHKNNSNSTGFAKGSFPLMTTEEFAQASFFKRLEYRVIRHPLTILFGYFTTFFFDMSLRPFLTNPKAHYRSGLAILLHACLAVGIALISVQAYLFGMLIPMIIAGSLGSYLFYAQHNFPTVKRRHGKDWDYVHAALNSSSFMRMWRVMHWFTGNIGYHHVHHLNAKIPFYRLPEAMAAIEELQNNPGTSLNPIEVGRCLRLKLWDPQSERLLTFREAKLANRAA